MYFKRLNAIIRQESIQKDGGLSLEVKFEIPEDKVIHFTENAKKRLIDEAQKYTLDIVNESERTEELLREDGASSEITNSTVIQAVRRNHTVRKKKTKIIVLRIIAEVFLFAAGIMFLPDSFVNSNNH